MIVRPDSDQGREHLSALIIEDTFLEYQPNDLVNCSIRWGADQNALWLDVHVLLKAGYF